MGTDQKASRAVTAFWLVIAFLFGMLIQAERTPNPYQQQIDALEAWSQMVQHK